MASVSSVKLVLGIFLIQDLWCGFVQSQPCTPGFGSELFLFRVPREHLQKGTRIGTILFNDCSGRTHIDFMSTNTRYHVDSDGTIKLNRQVTLHKGHEMFSVHAWDSQGKKHTALVRVEHKGQARHYHDQQEDADTLSSAQTESSSVLSLLEFPVSSDGLKRTKREWVMSLIKILENERGPFPKQVVQIMSSHVKETKMVYSISGEGADLPPVGLFTVDRNTGWIYVSKPLDREAKDKYELQAHAYSVTDPITGPMEVIVEVLDQNDNSPVFTQNPFTGRLPETAKIGFEFLTITATDADDPNTDNADIRYSIISQIPPEPNPNIFEINPVSGVIRVNAAGLDREKYPEYTLEIQAADLRGEGRPVTGKAVITVIDRNDQFLRNMGWLIPPIRIIENEQGIFPKGIGKFSLGHDKEIKVVYSITGEGADLPPVGLFTIDIYSGSIDVSRPLDREEKDKYELQIHTHSVADDTEGPALEIIVEVVDQNDNSPVFTQNPFTRRVPETAKIGFEFLTITATDADDPNTDNADIRYSIVSQLPALPSPNMFEINPVSGAIRVNAAGLDREKYPEYTLEIQAADLRGEGRPVTGKAVITVIDRNEQFLRNMRCPIPPIRILENEQGIFPKWTVKFSLGHDKETKVVYSITGEGADLPPVGLFIIDRNTGWLYVSKPLDREEKDKYELQVHARSVADDTEGPVIEIIVYLVDQNDNSPVFIQDPFIGRVPEGSEIGFEFLTITATDADDPYTDNADIRYSIVSQIPPEPSPNIFEINPISGAIRVNAAGLDREKYPEYTLEIQAADLQGEGHPVRGKAVITVTD